MITVQWQRLIKYKYATYLILYVLTVQCGMTIWIIFINKYWCDVAGTSQADQPCPAGPGGATARWRSQIQRKVSADLCWDPASTIRIEGAGGQWGERWAGQGVDSSGCLEPGGEGRPGGREGLRAGPSRNFCWQGGEIVLWQRGRRCSRQGLRDGWESLNLCLAVRNA